MRTGVSPPATEPATPRDRPAPRARIGRLAGRLCTALALALGTPLPGPAEEATLPRFRLAFTSGMFSEVNESDARAAMKVWMQTAGKDLGVTVEVDPQIYRSIEELQRACRDNRLDGIGLLTPEFAELRRGVSFDRFAVGVRDEGIAEEYVLLVHRDSGVERLPQLRGLGLGVLQTPRTSLALIWLDTVLHEAQLPPVGSFFGPIATNNKPDRVALPVFFRRSDACLITRRAFELLGELNPQVRRQLRVLAQSPAVVPSGFAFRSGTDLAIRAHVLAAMARLNESPAGQQILTLTQSDRIEERPLSVLDDSLRIIAAAAARPPPSAADPTGTGGPKEGR
jgi:phosphonate transport system substrate-binding protein